jgi:hypothetical protein
MNNNCADQGEAETVGAVQAAAAAARRQEVRDWWY